MANLRALTQFIIVLISLKFVFILAFLLSPVFFLLNFIPSHKISSTLEKVVLFYLKFIKHTEALASPVTVDGLILSAFHKLQEPGPAMVSAMIHYGNSALF